MGAHTIYLQYNDIPKVYMHPPWANIFPFDSSDQMLPANWLPYETLGLRSPTVCFLCRLDKCRSLDKKEGLIPLSLYTLTPFCNLAPRGRRVVSLDKRRGSIFLSLYKVMYLRVQTYLEFNTLFVWLYS